MNAYWLKLLAIAAMFLDHLGAIYRPDLLWLRIVGRLTMPIMCFFIAEGYRHTHDVKKYMGRLLLFAFLSEIPFDIAFTYSLFSMDMQNVFFTLFLGLLAIQLFERYRHSFGSVLVILCGVAAQLLQTDYGFVGVLLVVGFHLCGSGSRGYEPRNIWVMLGAVSLLLYGGTPQMFMLLAAIPLSLYNGERGPSLKYGFYLFYPLHLLFIAYIAGNFTALLS